MSDVHSESAGVAGEDVPLCGDPTCEGPGCRQSAIDAWNQRQWDEAGEIVAGSLGLTYDRDSGQFGRERQ